MSIEEIFQTMRELVAEQFALEPEEVTMDTAFEEDLGADSVDLVELVMPSKKSLRWAKSRKRISAASRPSAIRSTTLPAR